MKGFECLANSFIILSLHLLCLDQPVLMFASHCLQNENRDSPTYRLQHHHHNQANKINRTFADMTLSQELSTSPSTKYLI